MSALAGLLLGAWLSLGTATAAAVSPRCAVGCLPGGDASADLIYHQDGAGVTLSWSARGELPDGVELWYGNPDIEDHLERAPLRFEGGEARQAFTAQQLGEGTFLTVVVAGDEILHWKAWRLLTPTRMEEMLHPAPRNEWPVDLQPIAMRVERGSRSYPRDTGGDVSAWWSLSGVSELDDLDLDGPASGAPGLSVDVLSPWRSRGDMESKLAEALERVGFDDGYRVQEGELAFVEEGSREVTWQGQTLELTHYYTVVTLRTQANGEAIAKDQVLGKRRVCADECFSHETSATLHDPDDPRIMADYSPRDHSRDPELLALLAKAQDKGRSVPGVRSLIGGGGDGGSASVYRVAFGARVSTWDPKAKDPQPGFVAAEVVAARAGVATPRSKSSEAMALVPGLLTKLFGTKEAKEVQLDGLPEAYRAFSAVANAPMDRAALPWLGELKFAQRGATSPSDDPFKSGPQPDLSSEKWPFAGWRNVALHARLEAGAIVEHKGQANATRKPVQIIPVDAWVQYVVHLIVAAPPKAMDPKVGPTAPNTIDAPDGPVIIVDDPPNTIFGEPISQAMMIGVGLAVLALIALILFLGQQYVEPINRVLSAILPKPKDPPSDG